MTCVLRCNAEKLLQFFGVCVVCRQEETVSVTGSSSPYADLRYLVKAIFGCTKRESSTRALISVRVHDDKELEGSHNVECHCCHYPAVGETSFRLYFVFLLGLELWSLHDAPAFSTI